MQFTIWQHIKYSLLVLAILAAIVCLMAGQTYSGVATYICTGDAVGSNER